MIVAKLKLKTTSAGTSVRYNLQVDSDTGFATNLQDIDEVTVTGASLKATRFLFGFMDDAATAVARYYRILQTITGGGAATFDVEVQATPII